MRRQTTGLQLTAGAGVVAFMLIVNPVGANPTGIQIKENSAMAEESISKTRFEASAKASATATSTVTAKPIEDHTQCTAFASAHAQAQVQAGEEYDKDADEETVSGTSGECPANVEAKAKANTGSRTNGG